MAKQPTPPADEPAPTLLSLRDLGIQPGQARREELDVRVRPYHQGGFPYGMTEETTPGRVDVSAMQSGHAFHLRLDAHLHGPCSRCLEPAVVHIPVDAHEVHDPAANDPELFSDFVTEADELDLTLWAADAIGLEFPVRVLCQRDCAGLCSSCGTNFNHSDCDCAPPPSDSRWDALQALTFDDETVAGTAPNGEADT